MLRKLYLLILAHGILPLIFESLVHIVLSHELFLEDPQFDAVLKSEPLLILEFHNFVGQDFFACGDMAKNQVMLGHHLLRKTIFPAFLLNLLMIVNETLVDVLKVFHRLFTEIEAVTADVEFICIFRRTLFALEHE